MVSAALTAFADARHTFTVSEPGGRPSSGGRLRDFMSLVREIAIHGLMDGQAVVSAATIEAVVDDLRREREGGLNADEIDELQRVLDDPKHRLPGGEVALDLLDKHLLLAYPNESTWYLPHPVLMRSWLRWRTPSASVRS